MSGKIFVVLASLLILLYVSGASSRAPEYQLLERYELIGGKKEAGGHIAFPDVSDFCGLPHIAYREGDSHASDKGAVKIASLNQNEYTYKIEIKDQKYDIRNPYFVKNNENLYVYVSVFNFSDLKNGFIESRLYQISIGCNLLNDPRLIKTLDWSVVYMPLSLNIGSFGKFISDRSWCVSIFIDAPDCFKTYDEEMSLLKVDGEFVGILRNHPKVGLPMRLMRYSSSGAILESRDWCVNENSNAALVSPKLYFLNGNYWVAYAEREEISKSQERATIKLKKFRSIEALKNCNPDTQFKTPEAVNIDYGYPTIFINQGRMSMIWYETSGKSTKLFTSPIP